MLLRLRSRDGNFRFDFAPGAPVAELVTRVLETSPDADPKTVTLSNQPRGGEYPASKLVGRTLQSLGLKHGDLIFIGYKPKSVPDMLPGEGSSQTVDGQSAVAPDAVVKPWESVQEDLVDVYWRSKDGKISRKRDARFCTHGANGMCDYCMPLEPYDAAFHQEHNVKHLSYHAHLRKISPKSSTSSSTALPPLTPLSYKVKTPCPNGGHAPWPAGICTGCQPSAITLQSQPFRMVDHLEIASMDIIERFLQVWRKTGLQRFGFLIGRYEPYDEVPMGIKAVVEAIYEPPQQGELDGLTIGIPWEDEPRLRKVLRSAAVPLTIVGTVFTDLDPTPEDRTKNIYKRHPGSFFLSALEVIFAATLQQQHPTASRASPTGQFSSRMVTAVLTATVDGQVDVAAYQVSEQACAMVEADMIEASVDPGIMRVKEEDRNHDSARYVPDVFYSYKNEYGLEVKKSAKPCFPVEYLLVNVTHGFPQNPSPLFRSTSFKIENRPGLEDQQIEDVLSAATRLDALNIQPGDYRSGGAPNKWMELAKWLSDFHLVVFLESTQLFSEHDLGVIMRIVSSPELLSDPGHLDVVLETDGWKTLMAFAREYAPARPASSVPNHTSRQQDQEPVPPELYDQIAAEHASRVDDDRDAAPVSNGRTCPHCTYENAPGTSDCELCGLPLD